MTALGKGSGHAHLKDHAWFVAFAPVDKPMISVVVLVENAGMGGGVAAAPLAKEVFAAYFRKNGMLVDPPKAEEEAKAKVLPLEGAPKAKHKNVTSPVGLTPEEEIGNVSPH